MKTLRIVTSFLLSVNIYYYMTEKYSSLALPCQYDIMDSYIEKNKVKLTEQVVDSVQHALDNNLSSIEVFQFKDSDFVVMLERDSYIENLNNILKYYIDEELYELCGRIVDIKNRFINYEKTQTKRHKSKNTTER